MTTDELIWRVAGGSGDGVDSTGQNFTKALMRSGLHVFTHRHYPSRIRGGHTYVEIRASDEPVSSRGDGFNFLLALGDSFARNTDETAVYGNEEIKPLEENLDDLREGGVIVYDTGQIDADDLPNFDERVEENDWQVFPIDLRGIAQEHGREIMRNTAGVGVTAALVGIDLDLFEDLMAESMGDEILEANVAVLEQAYEQVTSEFDTDVGVSVPDGTHDEDQVLLSGSHGISYAAIDEGCRFIAGYPMTPWTDVFTIMSQELEEMGGIAEQVESEIAAASAAVGASYAGAKAMTGSSGGGFALMSEPLSMAEMTETPLVMVEAQRAGPSTGMPTKSEQADLEHVLYTGQGDHTRAVFAPGDPVEAYEQTRKAFQIAWKFQLPVIVLYDQKLAGEYRNVPKAYFDRDPNPDIGTTLTEAELEDAPHDPTGRFQRYQYDVEDNASPRSLPGQKNGRFLTTANEHWPNGQIAEDPTNRVNQVNRRLGKLSSIRQELDDMSESFQTYWGADDAEIGVITWGSQQGTVAEAIENMVAEGKPVSGLGVSELAPFPEDEIVQFVESVDEVVIVEMNASAQFRGLYQRELGDYGKKTSSLLKYNGEPFRPGEIEEAIDLALQGGGEPTAQVTLRGAAGD